VSVKVWIMDNALKILAHELGHAVYQVPNLAAYDEYHKVTYRSLSTEPAFIGHNPGDPSGQISFSFQKRFSNSYKSYTKTLQSKVASPFKMMNEISNGK